MPENPTLPDYSIVDIIDYAKYVLMAEGVLKVDGTPFTYEEALIEAYRVLYEVEG